MSGLLPPGVVPHEIRPLVDAPQPLALGAGVGSDAVSPTLIEDCTQEVCLPPDSLDAYIRGDPTALKVSEHSIGLLQTAQGPYVTLTKPLLQHRSPPCSNESTSPPHRR